MRMRSDGKRPAFKWGGRTGRCLTDRQTESWLQTGGRFALVPYSIGFSVLDVDNGPWQDLAAAFPPHAVIPSRKLWRRHLYYSDSEPRPNAQNRNLHGCHVDVRSASGYVALWRPEDTLAAAERPHQGVLFPWWTIWPEKGAQGPPKPPGNPPAPPPEERAREIPDLTDFWDRSTNDPAKAAYYVEGHAWRMWRPIHANNRRWHGDSDYDLEGRDAAALAMRTLGVSQEAIGAYHGISQRQVSRRLGGETRARGL